MMQKLLARSEISKSLTSQESNQILCYYKNTTQQIQVARISNIANWYFERVVFPGEGLLFEAFLKAELEIHTSTTVGAALADTILCSRLQVQS